MRWCLSPLWYVIWQTQHLGEFGLKCRRKTDLVCKKFTGTTSTNSDLILTVLPKWWKRIFFISKPLLALSHSSSPGWKIVPGQPEKFWKDFNYEALPDRGCLHMVLFSPSETQRSWRLFPVGFLRFYRDGATQRHFEIFYSIINLDE